MMVDNRGFSLVELMVVIAIVAILSMYAVPAYKQYVIAANFHGLVKTMESYVQRNIEYFSQNGAFASATQLGLDTLQTGYGSQQAYNPFELSPYFSGTGYDGSFVVDLSPDNCTGEYGLISFSLNPAALGFDSSVTQAVATCELWHAQGVVKHKCYYYYGDDTHSGTSNFISDSNWFNANVGPDYDFTNRDNMRSSMNFSCP